MWSKIAPKPNIETTNTPMGENSIPSKFEIMSTIFGKKDTEIKKHPIIIHINEYKCSKYLFLTSNNIKKINAIPIIIAINLDCKDIIIIF